ncbi:MAG: glycosyltransferase [Holophagales bacterium]|jgi:glycosyltransferase EpsH|nr:glycosyltransferase [Holophagales bacterium]
MPELSIIIPVYNTAQYLRACLDSALSQSFVNFELICVDNHSSDGSADILRDYAKKDSRIKYLMTDAHGRATETRQFGLRAASGEFITYIDSDDSVKPGMYEHMFREQKKHDADIVVCNYDLVYPDRISHSYSDMGDEVINIAETGYQYYFTKYFCMPRPNNYLWSRIIRRGIALEHGIEFQPVDISEDTIFTMFCTAFANRVVHISDSYYNYFQREDSTMRLTIRSKNIADSYARAFDCAERYINSHDLQEVFHDIMPMYAATRVRSIIFYIKLVGNDDEAAFNNLALALKGSGIPMYLRRAVSESLIKDGDLKKTIVRALEHLDREKNR